MKNLDTYITEKILINKNTKLDKKFNYQPTDNQKFAQLVKKLIKERGDNADLNDIDTQYITSFSMLFFHLRNIKHIDISKWNTKNVQTMDNMFYNCKQFDCDLSNWDISSVYSMNNAFYNCWSLESTNFDKWHPEDDTSIIGTFTGCKKIKTPAWYD